MICRWSDWQDCRHVRLVVPILVAALAGLFTADAALAQGAGCILHPASAPSRQVLLCRNGLSLEAENGADYTLEDSDRDGEPDVVNLQTRAVLVNVEPRSSARHFQVRTPQAIAAVRGTQWAVEVVGSKTSVFVLRGRVGVHRSNTQRGVTLMPGEGVDVEPGTAPLTVRRWPTARANALLARFGRQLQ
ncbi:FecR family protein (plasmid) [Microvirga terrae]|uniref:FecR family protein n=1 Tax=Microvirga terrae TaxID=2740529 RepID=A0ABY5RY56_9HYPH|nr:FecR domain-containing protein [Microvirga terrae]UVF22215.1 FecR family protein [Microvirga terrae]